MISEFKKDRTLFGQYGIPLPLKLATGIDINLFMP